VERDEPHKPGSKLGQARPPSIKELFQIIPTHLGDNHMQEKRVRLCPV